MKDVLAAAADLLFAGSCVGCGDPGVALCATCRAGLATAARPARPDPCPPGLVNPWAATTYDGTVRSMVLGLKEHRALGLARPLGDLLALAAIGALDGLDPGSRDPVILVPVPSRRATVRSRGHDATATITRRAADVLGARGRSARAVRLLRLARPVEDQSGLDSAQRSANLTDSMHVPTRALAGLTARCPRAWVVVCDDVITTGSTAREAQRALETVGVLVSGVAVVAATQRRVGT